MSRIARAKNTELYSSAYRMAWSRISAHQKRQPDIALHLHACIRRQIKKGAKDPDLIASEALRDLQSGTTTVTHKRDARTRRNAT